MHITRSIARGFEAGIVGTAVFDAWLFARYKQDGGSSDFADWESSAGLDSWDDAPAPALVGKRLVEAVSGHELAPQHARPVSNAMHWSSGSATASSSGSSPAGWAGRESATASCSGSSSGAQAT